MKWLYQCYMQLAHRVAPHCAASYIQIRGHAIIYLHRSMRPHTHTQKGHGCSFHCRSRMPNRRLQNRLLQKDKLTRAYEAMTPCTCEKLGHGTSRCSRALSHVSHRVSCQSGFRQPGHQTGRPRPASERPTSHGVNTNGSAAKVMIVGRLGQQVCPVMFGKIQVG